MPGRFLPRNTPQENKTMTGEQYKTVTDFEAGLKIGSPVLVKWTNSGNRYEAYGQVCKINKKSIRVRLTDHIPVNYYAGREIIVPRIDAIEQWSVNNRVEPQDGYK